MDNIIDLILYYSKNMKLPDEKFFKSVSEIVVKEKNLDDYLNKVVFLYSNQNIYDMGYSKNEKKIFVYMNFIRKSLIDDFLFSPSYNMYNGFERYFLIIFWCLLMFFHEIEHVNQQKKLNSKKEDFEYYLLYFSECENRKRYSQYYNNYHDLFPSERLADYYSSKYVLELIDKLKINISKIYTYFNKLMYYFLIKDYVYKKNDNILLSPTLLFLRDLRLLNITDFNNILDGNFKDILINAQNKNHYFRLKYGLPISKSVYDNFND